jgi:hypothetical protein
MSKAAPKKPAPKPKPAPKRDPLDLPKRALKRLKDDYGKIRKFTDG